jgi:microcystin-dependent protein
MSEPFIGEIKAVGYTFAPKYWAECNGQSMTISENGALFSLLGAAFGGNGTTNFLLPDMRGRVPVHTGTDGMGMFYQRGWYGGAEHVTISQAQMPAHTHTFYATGDAGTAGVIYTPNAQGQLAVASGNFYTSANPDTTLNSATISSTVGGSLHPNIQPTLALLYAIALEGLYPPRN